MLTPFSDIQNSLGEVQNIQGPNSVTLKNAMFKSYTWKKRFMFFYRLQSIMEGILGRNVEAGTKAEAREEQCVLVCCCTDAQLLSNIAQAHKPRDGTNHNGLGPPISVSNQGNDP